MIDRNVIPVTSSGILVTANVFIRNLKTLKSNTVITLSGRLVTSPTLFKCRLLCSCTTV